MSNQIYFLLMPTMLTLCNHQRKPKMKKDYKSQIWYSERKITCKLKTNISICKFRNRFFFLRREQTHKQQGSTQQSKPQNELDSTEVKNMTSNLPLISSTIKINIMQNLIKLKLHNILLKLKNIIFKSVWVVNGIFKHFKINYIRSKYIKYLEYYKFWNFIVNLSTKRWNAVNHGEY